MALGFYQLNHSVSRFSPFTRHFQSVQYSIILWLDPISRSQHSKRYKLVLRIKLFNLRSNFIWLLLIVAYLHDYSRSPIHPISAADVVEVYGTCSQHIYAHSYILRFMLNTWRESSPISRENSCWLWKEESILDLLSASMAGARIESLSSSSNLTVFDTLLSTYAYLFFTKFNAFCNLCW